MGKIVIGHTDKGVVIDVDTLRRFIEEAEMASEGHIDSIEALPHTAHYVGQMLAPLLED